MADYNYKIQQIVDGYPARAMRGAVLGSLLSSLEFKEHKIRRMMANVRKQWHARLVTLRKAKWEPILDGTDYQYMRNCPPFGVKTKSVARSCGRKFCPFCWARDVVSPAYDRVLHVISTDDEKLKKNLMLVEFSRTFRFSYQAKEASWPSLIDRVQRGRQRELENTLMQGQGAFVLHTIEPEAKRLTFRRRGLIVANLAENYVNGDVDVTPGGGGSFRWQAHVITKRSQLVPLLTRVCRYPAGLMRCPPQKLIEFSHATKSVRMSTWYGCLRQSKIHL